MTGRRRPCARLPRPPSSLVAHQCVILAVDTAQRSGWAVYVKGKLVSWGEIDMMDSSKSTDASGESGWDADRVCLHALAEAGFSSFETPEYPAVMVYERPFAGTYQGQWVGAWKAAWALNGGCKTRMAGVFPSEWRARVLGKGAGSAPRQQARAIETMVARKLSGRAVGPDEAAAICIGEWATRADVVRVMIAPRRPRPKRGMRSFIET